jgi:hypothetical protein
MKFLYKVAVGALAVAASGTLLYAAPGDDLGGDSGSVTDGKHAVKSKAEMADTLREAYASLSKKLDDVTRLRETAAKAKDVVKQNCLADTLIRMKGIYNAFDRAGGKVANAMNAGDDPTRIAQFDVAHDRIVEFGEVYDEALRCVGDDRTFAGDLQVEVSAPGGLDDPKVNPWDPGIEPPVYKTPF